MATKGDLIQAQSFSQRRLLTAFVSGAPGGKELEPAKPMRAVIAAIAISVALIGVGVFWGLVQPGLPQGWENGRLVLAKDTGARYVTVDGTLHPVVNTASGRLLIPSSSFAVISTSQDQLDDVPLGSTLGIVGAPDSLPAPSALVNDGWTSCVVGESALSTRIAVTPAAAATDDAVVVSTGDKVFVVAGNVRFPVTGDHGDAVLRAVGITTSAPQPVPASWINLFDQGTTLAPLNVSHGTPVGDSKLVTGEVVHIAETADDERFLITDDGQLAALSPLAWQLYQLGNGPSVHAPTEVSAAQVSGLQTATAPAGGADWPSDGFTALGSDQRPCALLTHTGSASQTVLAAQATSVEAEAGVQVTAGIGALVQAEAGDDSSRMLTLVDSTGTAFALPGATEETVARLGYATDDIGSADAGWTALLATGPALTTDAAGKTAGG
ncbi:type VII secretion protein EccB [Microbacterium protaetiae]|uniref:Type VII secretion protein EccB n=1 Tax=Microbacterium protaetiae TaxID=2509458 RepID=A0A4V0YD16_9MICO|nr:type VII secretion protein EccB [Microbacterium protaetiae]QAY59141.1 type VII secretion protein EccB [Microbacterium protaetiae]